MRALAATLLACALLPRAAQAGTTVSLFKSFAGNINFVTVGNTMRANDNNTNACSLVSGLTGTNVNAGTSSATVVAAGSGGIPTGSTVVAAYLYYAGNSTTVDTTVTFNGTSVTADQTYTDTTVEPFYGGFKDVTSLIPANPDTTYTVSGLAVTNTNNSAWCQDQTVLAGWALVIIYTNPSEANRVINVYNGFQLFQNNSITLTPANFLVPSPKITGSKFAVVTWEGDPTLSGNETLEFNGTVLTDTCNGTNNQYNSTINYQGTVNIDTCTGNATTDDAYYGVDIDTFPVDTELTAGESSATTFYQSGQDAVLLAAQIISISNVPVSDLSITKSHTGTLVYGTNATWTLAVANNGPATTAGTTTVTDTLPAGVTYVSASGGSGPSAWTCGAAGQTVTCTNTAAVASGSSFPNISLTAAIGGTAASPLANTATVSSTGGNFDNNSTNNSSIDSAAIVSPDLSNSTKSVFTVGGGDAVVGSTLQYTVTVTESAGVQANGVSVTDDIPANLSNFTVVSIPSGATDSSTPTGGANGDGKLNITGITVPANGSVTIVFTAQVKSGTANCINIDNTATVVNPDGPSANGATPSSSTVTVAQSSCASSGNKVLYVYDNLELTRTPQTANGTGVTINGGNATATYTLTPAIVAGKSLVLPAQNMSVRLICQATNRATGTSRTISVQILNGATSLGTGTFGCVNGPTAFTFVVATSATTVAAGGTLVMIVKNTNGTTNNHVAIFQRNATTGTTTSTITFSTSTVINVDSVTAYTTNYPNTTLPPNGVFLPGQTVFVCAVVSDPFGSPDTDPATGGTAPQITLTDPNGTVQVSNAAMTKETGTTCTGATTASTTTATEAYEYAFTTTSTVTTGFWNAAVTATEGTEGTVTDTANTAFDIDVPQLLITKTASVASDPVEGTTKPKAIPGATVTYTITVQNNGRGPADSGTLVISDPIPANTAMSLTAKPPFVFTNGATSSGLSVTSGSDANIVYSNNGGSSYVYTPTCTRPCTDTAITNFKITLTGSMNGKTGATAPSFNITFNVVIQ